MTDEVPLVTRNVVANVDFGFVVVKVDVEFEPIVSPGAELHQAALNIEREMGYIDVL